MILVGALTDKRNRRLLLGGIYVGPDIEPATDEFCNWHFCDMGASLGNVRCIGLS